jgi:hypothetical protein
VRILLRARKGPGEPWHPRTVLRDNEIGLNSGNLVFSNASYRLLMASGVEITADRFGAGALSPEWVNENFDVYVVPLANAFRRSFLTNLNQLTSLIERLRIPVVILGVGVQAGLSGVLPKDRVLNDAVARFARAVLERSPSIGVRGEFTESYLASLGFGETEVIGCPSLFMNGPSLVVREKSASLDRDAKINLNISPYVQALGPLVRWHVENHPNLVYLPQDLDTLRLLLDGVPLPGGSPHDLVPTHPAHPLFRDGRTQMYLDPQAWIQALAAMDFSFGTRIHGNIASLLAGTPCTLIAHDSRTLELARYFEIPHIVAGETLDTVRAADLYERADFSGLVARQPQRFERFQGFLHRHGLACTFDQGQSTEAHDRLIAAEVGTPRSPDGLSSGARSSGARSSGALSFGARPGADPVRPLGRIELEYRVRVRAAKKDLFSMIDRTRSHLASMSAAAVPTAAPRTTVPRTAGRAREVTRTAGNAAGGDPPRT